MNTDGMGGFVAMTLFDGFLIAYIVLAVASFLAYIPKLVGFFYAFKKPRYMRAQEKRMIGMVIPARNESAVIGDLFASIKKQDYDRNFFDVNVIVKDPDDPTIAMAKELGARVLVVPEQSCKGDALDAFFKSLSPEEMEHYDAFVIVDADGVLAPNYVTELNNALEHEHDIFLTRKYIKNCLGDRSKRTVFSNNSALTWAMLDDLGNRYRTARDIPLTLCGQGMMIRRPLVQTIGGWPYRTLTEDYELRLDGLLKGFRSMYWPYAVLYTEEALSHRDNYKRRLRWLTGYAQCDEKYKKQIKAQAKARGKMNRGELECLYGVYPLAFFAAASIFTIVAGCVLTTIYAFDGKPELMMKSAMFLIVTPFAVMYVLLFIYSLLAMTASREAFTILSFGEKLGTLLFAPLYILEYIPIYINGLINIRKKNKPEWGESKRERYTNIADDPPGA